MSKLTDLYPVGTPVRVTYEWKGEFYFFDGPVTDEAGPYPASRTEEIVGYVIDWENGFAQNVYVSDTIQDLESLHTPKES